ASASAPPAKRTWRAMAAGLARVKPEIRNRASTSAARPRIKNCISASLSDPVTVRMPLPHSPQGACADTYVGSGLRNDGDLAATGPRGNVILAALAEASVAWTAGIRTSRAKCERKAHHKPLCRKLRNEDSDQSRHSCPRTHAHVYEAVGTAIVG